MAGARKHVCPCLQRHMQESSLQFVGLSIVIEALCHQLVHLCVNLREGYQNVVKPGHAGRDALLDIINNINCTWL